MFLLRRPPRIPPAMFAAISLLTVELSVCATTEASCGAYLHTATGQHSAQHEWSGQESGRSGMQDAARLQHPILLQKPFEYDASQSEPVLPPCSGPGCRRGSEPWPVPIVPFSSETHRIDGGHLASRAPGSTIMSAFRPAPSESAHAERGFRLTIEIPPEFAG